MLKKIASDVLGLSDIGKIIEPRDFDKVDADDYILHEDQEKIYFIIKSNKDEYCFTNLAFIHVDGERAISSRRLVKRYNFYESSLSAIAIETAGTVDLDIELKFTLNDHPFSIDIEKKHLEQLKDIYKALLAIRHIRHTDQRNYEAGLKSLELTAEIMSGKTSDPISLVTEVEKINDYIFSYHKKLYATCITKDFGKVFEKYINN
ncbi:PH domain-containing protein [Candidatus Epulonipiscium viviparus]|uniref:PH domain-containing protein n=1 Tax=Candidatus Epulonipiscium viviparus TaxID=420336 RepID=UPI00273810F5|nr:PH domain-containing protein [Candidatus Epulopiscium viviparus]